MKGSPRERDKGRGIGGPRERSGGTWDKWPHTLN
jgi:hypothetical protein